jgi:hypothetical protein
VYGGLKGAYDSRHLADLARRRPRVRETLGTDLAPTAAESRQCPALKYSFCQRLATRLLRLIPQGEVMNTAAIIASVIIAAWLATNAAALALLLWHEHRRRS